MKMTIKGTNIDLTPEIRAFVDEKLAELDKFIPEGTLAEMRIELQRTTFHHRKGKVFRAEANIMVPGRVLRAEAVRDDLFPAITEIKDELQRELKKYKNRQHDLQRRGERSLKKRLSLSRLAWRKKDIHDKNL